MRKSCPYCAIKHVGKAMILFSEAQLGYPLHFWLGLANLSEAEDELVYDYPDMATKVRRIRLDIEIDPTQSVVLIDLIYELSELIKSEVMEDEGESESTE